MMNPLPLILETVTYTLGTLMHNWPYLALSAAVAAWMRVFMDQRTVAAFLQRNRGGGVVAATAIAVATPLCSCGTTALILGMMANLMPWAPIVAFMVASPLTSPEGVFYSAGLFGWPFAIAFFIASILLGLLGGWAAQLLEQRHWLDGQARMRPPVEPVAAAGDCGCPTSPASVSPAPAQSGCGCGAPATPPSPQRSWRRFPRELLQTAWNLLLFFLAFASIGHFLNSLIPAEWMGTLFGAGRAHSVPLAATLGIPFYINSEASLPLVRTMLDAGMSPGAALAFLITGSGTSIGAITGALTIARWRVVGLVVATLWVGAILAGFGFDAVRLFAGW